MRVRLGLAGIAELSWAEPCLDDAKLPAIATDRGPLADLALQVHAQLDAYFAGRLRTFTVPVAAEGTAFQQRVWEELRRIPYGTTLSYGELARRIGQAAATRAVGAANGRNPVPILIPCHRVVATGGGLGGFSAGLARKRWLLALEQYGPAAAALHPVG